MTHLEAPARRIAATAAVATRVSNRLQFMRWGLQRRDGYRSVGILSVHLVVGWEQPELSVGMQAQVNLEVPAISGIILRRIAKVLHRCERNG